MTNTLPPPVAWIMAIGFMPTHVVLLTANVAVLMVLMETDVLQREFGPELRTYITPLSVELRATGCEPLSRLMVVMVSEPVKAYSLTVSLPPLDTNSAPRDG